MENSIFEQLEDAKKEINNKVKEYRDEADKIDNFSNYKSDYDLGYCLGYAHALEWLLRNEEE